LPRRKVGGAESSKQKKQKAKKAESIRDYTTRLFFFRLKPYTLSLTPYAFRFMLLALSFRLKLAIP
jgi:hypothetical protein